MVSVPTLGDLSIKIYLHLAVIKIIDLLESVLISPNLFIGLLTLNLP